MAPVADLWYSQAITGACREDLDALAALRSEIVPTNEPDDVGRDETEET